MPLTAFRFPAALAASLACGVAIAQTAPMAFRGATKTTPATIEAHGLGADRGDPRRFVPKR